MRAVLVAGSTGEAPTLDAGERRGLVRAVRAAVPAGVPVIAGTGAPSAPAGAPRRTPEPAEPSSPGASAGRGRKPVELVVEHVHIEEPEPGAHDPAGPHDVPLHEGVLVAAAPDLDASLGL